MPLTRKVALFGAALALSGCRSRPVVPESPSPPNTLLLSAMMRDLSTQPEFPAEVLSQLEGARARSGKKGPALLTPRLLDELRKRLLGKDWQGLDRFPGWSMREINPTVHAADEVAGSDPTLEGLSAVHPGSPAPSLRDGSAARAFLDLGPYPLDRAQTLSLAAPSLLPGFTVAGIVTRITDTVTRGDGPSDLAPEHAASQRLADVLNRLAVNQLPGAGTLRVHSLPAAAPGERSATGPDAPVQPPSAEIATPEALLADLLASGHTVSVTDSRYFANFGHLHYKGMDVMMPFWINTQIAVPHSGGLWHRRRPLLIPVSHAEYEWHIRGPYMNADVSHYFGVDGKAEWRTMDTLDQAWVSKRDAHTYTGAQAVEVTRLLGLITLAYMHQHAQRPNLPFGGYYELGVCQDPVSAVEIRMTGHSTLFPNTVNSALFDDPRDHEVNALFAAIPKDRAGTKPPPDRIFGSLPVAPGPENSFSTVRIPGLASDLQASYAAWRSGELKRTHGRLFPLQITLAGAAGLLLLFGLAAGRRPSRRAGRR